MSRNVKGSFLDACGGNGPLSLRIEGSPNQMNELRSFNQPFVLIGRDPRVEVPLPDPQVSRRHTYLQMIDGAVFWLDLESRSGTHWEGQTKPFGWLERGQMLRIGGYQIHLDQTGATPEAKPTPTFNPLARGSAKDADRQGLTLEICQQGDRPIKWPINRWLVLVGASQDCRVRLHGEGVSRIHCALVNTPHGLWAIDLLGQGGIWVNEQKVRLAPMGPGDVLRISNFLIQLPQPSNPPSFGTGGLPFQESPPLNQATAEPLLPLPTEVNSQPAFPLISTPQPSQGEYEAEPKPSAIMDLVPGGVGQGRAAMEEVVLPLVQQFSMMQNQMFAQFQQTLMMMMQMFGTLQRDQANLLREELARVQEITRELETLKKESLNNSPAARTPSAQERKMAKKKRKKEIQKKTAEGIKTPLAKEEQSPVSGKEVDEPVTPEPTAPPAQDVPPQPPQPASPQVAEQPSAADMHGWFCQRMTELEQERQSRWQKILNIFTRH